MKQKIAVEPNLTQVKDLLSSKGFQVDSVNVEKDKFNASNNYDAIVVTGMNANFLGINDTSTKAAIINAEGMTADEIFHEIQARLQ